MAVITPNSTIRLIKCPIELDQNNQLTFANSTAQLTYFNSLPHLEVENYTYQRKDGVIRMSGSRDDLQAYNYVIYQNENHGSKWFFAFIEELQYINDNMTAIKIKTDVYQTYQFDITLKPSFTEREHVANDSVGLHTVPEGLELGEYICNGVDNLLYYDGSVQTPISSSFICVCVSEMAPSLNLNYNTNFINGLYSGLQYLIIPAGQAAMVTRLIRVYDKDDKSDAIISIFYIPTNLVGTGIVSFGNITTDFGLITLGTLSSDTYEASSIGFKTIAKNSTLDGYTPKNNKMYTWPYSYLSVTNNSGIDVVYKYEDFNGDAQFQCDCALTQGCSIKLYPVNYKRTQHKNAYNYGITGQKLPICAWTSDYYLNWETQNGVNLAVQTGISVVGSALGIATSAGSGNPGGAISSGLSLLSTTANALQQVYEAQLVPNQAKGNINAGDINFSENKCGFTFFKMSIREEYARIVDDYLSMYGYKVNRLKVPATTSRTNWNFVKTIGCNLIGDLPQDDLEEIKSIFNNGVTLWHNPSTFLDYSQSNTIVS